MQTHRGISKITAAGVKDVILISITAVCLLMIFAIFALLILVKEIVFFLCGLSIRFYKRLSELLKHGVSNIKRWVLDGQKQIKNR